MDVNISCIEATIVSDMPACGDILGAHEGLKFIGIAIPVLSGDSEDSKLESIWRVTACCMFIYTFWE
jgi:hypothetical protein